MVDEPGRPPHVQRCTYTEIRGRRHWQCRLPDPHPDLGHDFPPDAEFGRILHEQPAEWLAAQLRARVARQRNMQRRLDEAQAVALDLARLNTGTPAQSSTREWLLRADPGTVDVLDGMFPAGWWTP